MPLAGPCSRERAKSSNTTRTAATAARGGNYWFRPATGAKGSRRESWCRPTIYSRRGSKFAFGTSSTVPYPAGNVRYSQSNELFSPF